MNASPGFFAVELATNLRYLPHHRAWQVTQMSAGRLRSTRKLRSRSSPCSGYRLSANTPRAHALTTFRTRSPSRTGDDHDVRSPRERPDPDRVAVFEAVVGARGRVADDPDTREDSQREERVAVIAA